MKINFYGIQGKPFQTGGQYKTIEILNHNIKPDKYFDGRKESAFCSNFAEETSNMYWNQWNNNFSKNQFDNFLNFLNTVVKTSGFCVGNAKSKNKSQNQCSHNGAYRISSNGKQNIKCFFVEISLITPQRISLLFFLNQPDRL